eukprot:SAG31_NODE_6663_length_1934_cov_1.413079_2_plen_119_part_00
MLSCPTEADVRSALQNWHADQPGATQDSVGVYAVTRLLRQLGALPAVTSDPTLAAQIYAASTTLIETSSESSPSDRAQILPIDELLKLFAFVVTQPSRRLFMVEALEMLRSVRLTMWC